MGSRKGSQPILVTGVPRSGTTWLARLLASSAHTSMPGREPMNPRGRQFALGGTLDAWVRRETFSEREATVVRRCYAGREPRTFSRYGIRQWAAPLPSTRIVIKDPFALLSIGAVHQATEALPVLLYRHPGAVLASYRRMGWTADTAEFAALGAPAPLGPGDLEAMAAMWSWAHQTALADIAKVDDALIVSHHALTVGGAAAHAALLARLGLEPGAAAAQSPDDADASAERREGVLHDFSRSRADVESGWRERLSDDEVRAIEAAVAPTWRELEDQQFALPTPRHGVAHDPTLEEDAT